MNLFIKSVWIDIIDCNILYNIIYIIIYYDYNILILK